MEMSVSEKPLWRKVFLEGKLQIGVKDLLEYPLSEIWEYAFKGHNFIVKSKAIGT